MEPRDAGGLNIVLNRIRSQAAAEEVRVTQHAQQEMVEEGIGLDEVLQAIQSAEVLEPYPEHKRGPCCLLVGSTQHERWLHVVCTMAQPILVIITVYEPKLPKWATPTQRGRMS